MTKYYNVVSRKTVTDNSKDNGKHIYHKIGVVKITNNGGWFLQLYHAPDTNFMIFPNHNENLPVIDFSNHETS